MEHSEIISNALSYTKKAFFSVNNLPRWFMLLLYVTIPMVLGYVIASIIFQLAVLPLLVSIFVNENFGFTESSISGILQVFAIIIGLLCIFFVPLIQGYVYRIFKSGEEVPDYKNRWGLYFSGWRVNGVLLYYAIPLIIISIIYLILFAYVFPNAISYAASSQVQFSMLLTGVLTFIYVALEFVTFIFVCLFAFIGLAHLARSGSMKEATGVRKIKEIISKIGWYDYILSLVIMSIIFLLVSFIFVLIAQVVITNLAALFILVVIYLFVLLPLITFFIKYLSEVYDSAYEIQEDDDSEFDFF